MKKKSLILVLLFLVCLTACGETTLEESETQVEKVVEKQETPKTEPQIVHDPKKDTSKPDSKDPTKLNYWIVFYDVDGKTELQRTAEPYGTTPVYKGEDPSKTIGSVHYAFTGWDKEFKPITTNTYIYAQANKTNVVSNAPAPQPQPVVPTEVPITPVVEPTYRVTLSPFWPFIIVRPGK